MHPAFLTFQNFVFEVPTMFSAFATFAANATKSAAKSAGKQQKKSKSAEKERKQAQAKPRKELDYLKVSSSKLTREQMRELLGFVDHDSHERRVAQLALLAGKPTVVTLSLRFESELRPAQRDAAGSASETEQDDQEQPEQPTVKVLTGARLVALDKTVYIPLDANEDGKPVLYQESVQAAVAELLGVDAQFLEEFCFLYTGANPVRDNEDLFFCFFFWKALL